MSLGAATTTLVAASAGYWAMKVDAVRLSDDEEPWIKGTPRSTTWWPGLG